MLNKISAPFSGSVHKNQLEHDRDILDLIVGAKSYEVRIEKNNELRSYVYNVTGRVRTDTAEDYSQSTRRISDNGYFFPLDEHYRLGCRKIREEEMPSRSEFLLSSRIKRQARDRYICHIGDVKDVEWDVDSAVTVLEDAMFRNRTVTLHYKSNDTEPVPYFDHAKCRSLRGKVSSIYL